MPVGVVDVDPLVGDSVEGRGVGRDGSFGREEEEVEGFPLVADAGEYIGLVVVEESGGFTEEEAVEEEMRLARGVAWRGIVEETEEEEAELRGVEEVEVVGLRAEVEPLESLVAVERGVNKWEEVGGEPVVVVVANLVPAVRFVMELPRGGIMDLGEAVVAVVEVAAERCGGVVGVRLDPRDAEELFAGLAGVEEVGEVLEAMEVPGADDRLNVRLVLVSFDRLKRGLAVWGFCGVAGFDDERFSALAPAVLLGEGGLLGEEDWGGEEGDLEGGEVLGEEEEDLGPSVLHLNFEFPDLDLSSDLSIFARFSLDLVRSIVILDSLALMNDGLAGDSVVSTLGTVSADLVKRDLGGEVCGDLVGGVAWVLGGVV